MTQVILSDRYQEAVNYLTRFPRQIVANWRAWNTEPAGCLFAPVVPDLSTAYDGTFVGRSVNPHGDHCGCLTQIRSSPNVFAWTSDLTERIRADARIPIAPHLVKVEHLPVFAQWQRVIDAELRLFPRGMPSEIPEWQR